MICPASLARTAGVNHAVAPSNRPPASAPSQHSPSITLFTSPSLRRDLSLWYAYNEFPNSFKPILCINPRSATRLTKYLQSQYEEPVPTVKTRRPCQMLSRWAPDREPVQVSSKPSNAQFLERWIGVPPGPRPSTLRKWPPANLSRRRSTRNESFCVGR